MYTIIKAELDDIEQIWELGRDVEKYLTPIERFHFWTKDILNNCVDKDDVIINVAKVENEVIGFIIANCNNTLRKAEIENIVVKVNHRNRGIGSSLLGKTIDELYKLQFSNICALENDAIEFYKKSNFTEKNRFTWLDLLLSNGNNK